MLTRRRHQFLEHLKKLYRETSAPVHYIAVAEALGVSKWTAYDVLTELEKEGYLEREYIINSSEKVPGRSMIMFVPTSLAEKISKVKLTRAVDWHQARSRLLDTLGNLSPDEVSRVIRELLDDMPGMGNPLITCAYGLTILLVLLKALGKKAMYMVHRALKKAPRPDAGLFIVTGTGIGLVANMLSQSPVIKQLDSYLYNLQEQIDNLTGGEHKLLLDFVKEALEKDCLSQ